MTDHNSDRNTASDNEVSRRSLIKRLAVGSAFAIPVVASFDMASLGVSSAFANNANQSPFKPLSFGSADAATFTVGKPLTFAIWTPGTGLVTVTQHGKLPAGVTFTQIPYNYDDNNDCNAIISGKPKPNTHGVYHITLTASNGFEANATQKFTLTVDKAPKPRRK
jgi:Putative Ig domain